MEIAYLQPLSLLDYPGRVSAVVWTVGCNLRCPFCYNAELVVSEQGASLPRVSVIEVLARLKERARFLDGVVITGGEPTLHPDLQRLLRDLKRLGLLVKLDTNGTGPDVLRPLIEDELVDYVALDLKAPSARYPEFTGMRSDRVASELVSDGRSTSGHVPDVVARVQESISVIRELAPDYEFRTTVAPGLAEQDLITIARELRGARRYVLQPFFAPEGKRLVDETWRGRPALSPDALRAVLPELQKLVPTDLRG